MEIRRYLETDAEALSALVRRGLLEVNIRDYSRESMEAFAAEYTADKIREIAGMSHTYVLLDEGRIVGTGSIADWTRQSGAEAVGRERMILTLFLLPEYIGKGDGRLLMETLEQDELFRTADHVSVNSSISAAGFYERMGYQYRNGEKRLIENDHYEMEKWPRPGVSTVRETPAELEELRQRSRQVTEELLEAAKLLPGQILVVGCSSSEVTAHKIGSFSSAEVGRTIFQAIYECLQPKGIYLAAQCCEHLNRCLIVERACAKAYDLEEVNAVPQLKAGGSFATAAYSAFSEPAAVEFIRAHAGIDIGDTLIGMHLRPVAVPVRTSVKEIGSAHVVCARTRLRFIGGERTAYKK